MGAKKRLRRQIATLEQRLAQAVTAERASQAGREALMEQLADAGLVLVTGARTRGDRLRAARNGVIVLSDVRLLGRPQMTAERATIRTMFQGDVPGPIRASLRLEFEAEPEILAALRDSPALKQ